jgi:NADH-quinone oxidoreductase subunit M
VLAVFGMVLGAWYMLWLVQRVFFGPLREETHSDHDHPIQDLSLREVVALVPLAVLVFWIGICPQFFLRPIAPSLNQATVAAQERIHREVAAPSPAAARLRVTQPGGGAFVHDNDPAYAPPAPAFGETLTRKEGFARAD